MSDWASVAKAVNDRMHERGLTQRELAERSGLSVATLRKIQHGQAQTRTRATLASLSRALGFRDDHLWRIAIQGQPPTETHDASDVDDLRAELADLRTRVQAIEVRLNQ